MKKRIFIAIPLPQEIKSELSFFENKQKKLNVRWTKSENLHFTLLFIGWIEEDKIKKVKEALIRAVKNFSPFALKLERIVLGPSKENPRMIWVTGETLPELQKLKEKVENELKKNNISFDNSHPLKLHITLARARGKTLFGRKIEENLGLAFPVKEICLMESELKKQGAEYTTLESVPLFK